MKNALIVIDLQNDFLPGGALPIKRGNEIIQPINQIMSAFDWVLASKDWHPEKHTSFAQIWNSEVGEVIDIHGVSQILWPMHCVENTFGSEYPEYFNEELVHHTFFKGTNKNVDSYSIFFDQIKNPASAIVTFLTVHQIDTLYFVGLATEYCVKYSVLDALQLGYKVNVVTDCCRGMTPEGEKEAFRIMQEKGAALIQSLELEKKRAFVKLK